MIHAYRFIYLKSPHAPPTLWEWKEPYIHNLIVNSRSFGTTQVEQRYFRDWDALSAENSRIWEDGPNHRIAPYLDEEGGGFVFDEVFIEVEFPFQVVVGWRGEACGDGNQKQRAWIRGSQVGNIHPLNHYGRHAVAP